MTLTQIKRAGLDGDALDRVFTVGASGTDHYTFQGEGLNGTVNDPTLYLTRGKTYRFEKGSSHPLRIQSTAGSSGTPYNTGVTNNGGTGTVIMEVQHDAPDVLYYQCTSHPNMNGVLYITGALADGGVTTAKLANDAVTTNKIAANSVTSAKIVDASILQNDISDNAISTAKLQNSAVTTTKIGADAITGAKIADDAVGNEHLAANCVNTVQIADSQVTTNKIANDAVTGAKIADDSITSAHLASNSVNTAELIDDAVNSEKIADANISNNHINANAAIAGTKITPTFGSQNIESTGYQTLSGELKLAWSGHQNQCAENTHNTNNYWKVVEVTGGGSEGGQIIFFGTNSYSSNTTQATAGRTTLIVRHTTDNKLDGYFWSESGGNPPCADIRWKYNGANNVYTIWIKKGAYNNVVPHVTGSFDHVTTYGSSTNSGGIPSGSTAFDNRWAVEMKDNSEPAFNINNEALITYPTRPCFHGGIMANDSSGIVEYDQVHVNRGSHYATSNDRFVCPVDGIYYVGLFGMSHDSQGTMDIAIRKNGSDYNGVVPYSGSHTGAYHHVSGQGLISCSENDYLQVNIGSGSFYGTNSGRHSGFTVFLVA